MAETNGGARRFRRLSGLVTSILRVFKVNVLVSGQGFSNRTPRTHPNLEQLVLQGGRQRIIEQVQQRLQRGAGLLEPSKETSQSGYSHQLLGLSQAVKSILCCPPWNRSTSDIEIVRKELQKSHAFQDYPIYLQTAICKVAWYQQYGYPQTVTHYYSLTGSRLIVKTGHQATNFYIILSGKVIISSYGEENHTLQEGDTFGDIEITSGSKRTNTCIVAGSTELLVISKSDYLDLGLRQGRKSFQKAKPYEFCRTIGVLKYWPLAGLEKQPDTCKIFYCRPNHVVVKDSKKSDWIFIVMTGTCRVVKRFIDTPPVKRLSMPVAEGRKMSIKGGMLPESPLLTEKSLVQRSRTLKHSYTTGNIQTIETGSRPPARKQFLVQLEILHPKDIFGLSALIYDNEPSVTLVSETVYSGLCSELRQMGMQMSNGAELVVLAKSFILSHMTESIKIKLRRQVGVYPPEDAMRKRIRDHYTWNMFKQVNQARRKI